VPSGSEVTIQGGTCHCCPIWVNIGAITRVHILVSSLLEELFSHQGPSSSLSCEIDSLDSISSSAE
jgi:hypothetical protein